MQVEICLPNGYNIMGGYKMKKNLSRILSVFLVVLLLASLPMAQAFAAYDCKYGTYSELVLAQFSGKDDNNLVGKASISSGDCPGMSLKLSADATQILLSGTPTRPGTYKLTVAFEMRDGQPGSTDATVNVAAVQPTVQASASTTAPKKDDNFQLKLSLTGGAPYEVTLYTNTSNSTSGGAAGTTWTFESDSQNVTVGTKGMESSVQTYYYYLTVKNSAGTATSNVVAVTNPSYTTVTPSPSPSPAGEIKITKQPTGETVEEGGRAVFIARAENAASFVWRIVSPDTTNTYPAKDAPDYFKGLKVSGTDSDRLVLENIPASMNGWKAECKFIAADGKTYLCTNGAIITVKKAEVALKRPTINTQPSGVTKTVGEGTTLTVSASDTNNGGTLKYQWYSNTSASNNGGTLISGATSASYTPPQTEGTVYYFASVWSTKGGQNSDRVNTGAVAVTYTAAVATPTPTVTVAPTSPTPGVDDPSPSPSTGGNADIEIKPDDTQNNSSSGNGLVVLLLVIAGLGLIAAAVLLILSKRDSKPVPVKRPSGQRKAAGAAKRGWTCENCGEVNLGRFCQNCGAPKPANEPLYICDKCGWQPEDPMHPPRFCPQCGDPFGPEDIVEK